MRCSFLRTLHELEAKHDAKNSHAMRLAAVLAVALVAALPLATSSEAALAGDVDGSFSHDAAAVHASGTEEEASSPTPTATPQPYHLPLTSCGLPLADTLVCHPIFSVTRTVRTYFRGFIQALRDLLFARAMRSRPSPLDTVLEDEGVYDFERRMEIAAALGARARDAGLVDFAAERPDTFRYAAAVALGVVMLLTLATMQTCGTLFAKGLAWVLLKATGNPLFEDTPLLGPRTAMDLTPAEEHEQRRWKMEEEEEEEQEKEKKEKEGEAVKGKTKTA